MSRSIVEGIETQTWVATHYLLIPGLSDKSVSNDYSFRYIVFVRSRIICHHGRDYKLCKNKQAFQFKQEYQFQFWIFLFDISSITKALLVCVFINISFLVRPKPSKSF